MEGGSRRENPTAAQTGHADLGYLNGHKKIGSAGRTERTENLWAERAGSNLRECGCKKFPLGNSFVVTTA